MSGFPILYVNSYWPTFARPLLHIGKQNTCFLFNYACLLQVSVRHHEHDSVLRATSETTSCSDCLNWMTLALALDVVLGP